ncbi:hypothetical protein GCM10028817_12000 [Spirosoma pomorum]
MTKLSPQLVGEWMITETQISVTPASRYGLWEAKITKDTILQNIAKLVIRPAANPRNIAVQARYPEFDGTIQYKNKTYPIYFYLITHPERLTQNTGPQAFFSLQYDFPSGSSHPTEPEESYLQNIGLIGDNFYLSIQDGQSEMIWQGLNRGIKQATLRKK